MVAIRLLERATRSTNGAAESLGRGSTRRVGTAPISICV